MTRSQNGRMQNGSNMYCFGPMADAGYLSVRVIIFQKIYISVPVQVIHRVGNRPENTVIDRILAKTNYQRILVVVVTQCHCANGLLPCILYEYSI